MTHYTVLAQEHENGWMKVGETDASSGDQAIRKLANDGLGIYVAVPARSFRPMRVAVKQREPLITITPIK